LASLWEVVHLAFLSANVVIDNSQCPVTPIVPGDDVILIEKPQPASAEQVGIGSREYT
jgi:hypothetical protein